MFFTLRRKKESLGREEKQQKELDATKSKPFDRDIH